MQLTFLLSKASLTINALCFNTVDLSLELLISTNLTSSKLHISLFLPSVIVFCISVVKDL
ncbi:hypothetical protein QJR44_05865 [Paraclostridium sordellii]|nr:hypothetical protein [Paeniclostridium sordellii]